MDLKALKLELLERIAALGDEGLLLAVKRLLDTPRGYGVPNEHLSIVKEGQAPYPRLEDRNYSAAEVQALLDDIRSSLSEERTDHAGHFTREEWDAMDREREQASRGEGNFHTLDEALERMKKDLGE